MTTTVIVVLVAVGLALLGDAVVVAAKRRALAKAHGRRSGAQASRRSAEVIDFEAARRAARLDERAASAEDIGE